MGEPHSAGRRADTDDKLLFTPGPLTTSRSVKEAMLQDLGSRDDAFIGTVRALRQELLRTAGVSQEAGYEAVLMQGSGTFGLEAVVSSAVPEEGHLLVLVNGAYGERVAAMARRLRIATTVLRTPEDTPIDPQEVAARLEADATITDVSIVHCETTTGILNPVEAVGRVVRGAGRRYHVDAMSSFGAIPLDLQAAAVDFLVTSSNKCL